jgi:hypothetical protein
MFLRSWDRMRLPPLTWTICAEARFNNSTSFDVNSSNKIQNRRCAAPSTGATGAKSGNFLSGGFQPAISG